METEIEVQEERRSRGPMVLAFIVAAILVVAVLAWMTDSLPFSSTLDSDNVGPISVDVVETPAPTSGPSPETVGRITTEAALSDPTPAPEVAGATTTAPTGPVEWALAGAFGMALLGFGGSLALFRLA